MTAHEINQHLKSGGVCQVTTHLRSTVYTADHAGWFVDKRDGLYVRRGKRLDYLGPNDRPNVGIRLGRHQ